MIIWAFSPFLLWSSVNCSCCVNSLLSSCDILAAAAALVPFDGAALPVLNCSFSTDNFKFNDFNSTVVSSKRLSINYRKKNYRKLVISIWWIKELSALLNLAWIFVEKSSTKFRYNYEINQYSIHMLNNPTKVRNVT